MDVGIGLPNAIPGTTGEQLVEWARRAEGRGFPSLGTIDRVVYDNYEPLTALAAAAAVTERIELSTSVLLGPLRPNVAMLAKQALSVHAISGGRFTLGIGLGARDDDYEASGVSLAGRGAWLDQALERIGAIWRNDNSGIGPKAAGAPRLLVGGGVEASFARAARFADGWIAGGSGPDAFAEAAEKVRAAWGEAGRDGSPRLAGLAYFALGPDAERDAQENLGDYYAWLGDEVAAMIAGGAIKDAGALAGLLEAYEAAGCDELILFPSASDPAQVDLLAEALGR